MTETGDRSWKKPQIVKEYAKSITKKHPTVQKEIEVWAELRDHPAWNNLFTLMENHINRRVELEKKSDSRKHHVRDTKVEITIKKKYRKYKKRYKLFKSESSRMSDSSSEYQTDSNQKVDCVRYKRDDTM